MWENQGLRKPTRVLLVIRRYWPAFSGAALQQHAIFRELGKENIRVTVLTAHDTGLPRRETLDGVEIHRVGPARHDRLGRLQFLWSVWHSLRRLAAWHDVVHAFSCGWATFVIPRAARRAGLPAIYSSSLQGSDDADAVSRQGLGRTKVRLLRQYDHVVSYTPAQSRSFVDHDFDESAVRTVTCGVDDRFFAPGEDDARRRALRHAAGRDDDGPVVLFIGTLTRRKGVDLLIDAFERFLRTSPAAVLVLMGPKTAAEDNNLDEAFVRAQQQRCAEGTLAGHVLFLGRIDSAEDKRSIVQASDALALFSQAEGLGIVILEAMACGRPAILTPIPGVFDHVVTDGVDGRIATSRDVDELAELLRDVVASRERSREMGRRARETIEQRFSLTMIAREYLGLYREAQEEKRR